MYTIKLKSGAEIKSEDVDVTERGVRFDGFCSIGKDSVEYVKTDTRFIYPFARDVEKENIKKKLDECFKKPEINIRNVAYFRSQGELKSLEVKFNINDVIKDCNITIWDSDQGDLENIDIKKFIQKMIKQ